MKLKSTVSNKHWINSTPQSTRFCRPLRIAFEKENDDTIMKEYTSINKSIRLLASHKFKLKNGKSVKIKYCITETLCDQKCVNTIVGNKSTNRCPICFKTAHQFGQLESDFIGRQSSLQYGLDDS